MNLRAGTWALPVRWSKGLKFLGLHSMPCGGLYPFSGVSLTLSQESIAVSESRNQSRSGSVKHSGMFDEPIPPMSEFISLSWSAVVATVQRVQLPSEKLSNYDLVLRCQEGNRPESTAFAELLKRYQSHVDRVLYHLAPDWQDRADLAQEVWIRVYRNINRLQEPVKFRGWLSRIATNLFYDELRKRKRVRTPLSLDVPRALEDGEIDWELPADSPGPDEDLTTREFYDQLRVAIADLPEVFRTTIVLREIEGLAYEEIAEMTGVSLGTVKSRIARARQRLQLQLQKYLDGH